MEPVFVQLVLRLYFLMVFALIFKQDVWIYSLQAKCWFHLAVPILLPKSLGANVGGSVFPEGVLAV